MNTLTENTYRRWTILYILAFSLVWWAVFCISRHHLDGADMVENYAWGQEWQWGNNKHPPLFGWIVATWFRVFPRTDWAYYLLNEVNLGIALMLLALAMHRVLSPEKVLAAVILTLLGAHFGPDSGYKYNANTAQLPFIAAFAWSMLHAMERRRYRWFIGAGVFGAAALLTKYYALVLFFAIGLSLLMSLRPPLGTLLKRLMLTAVTALALVMPHVVWSVQHDWLSLHYMHAAHETVSPAGGFDAYVIMLAGGLLFSAVALLAWAVSLIRLPVLAHQTRRESRLGLNILVLSVITTLIAAWIQGIDPVSSWLIPALLFVGWALIDLIPVKYDTAVFARRIALIGVFYLIAALAVAVWWGQRFLAYPAPPPLVLTETLATDVTRNYRQTYGQAVQYVAGDFPIPYGLAFYSPDHPHALYGLDLAQSPWINARALQAGNKVVVCGTYRFEIAPEPDCISAARKLFGPPDQKKRMTYPVYDPKTKRLGRQAFEVLSWKPARSTLAPDRMGTRLQNGTS